MVLKSLLLSALVGCHLAAVSADQFVITEQATEPVASTDVETVRFVKYIVVDESPVDPGVYPSGLGFGIPGRIFVDYVDNAVGSGLVTNTTVAVITVSGDEFDAVNQTRSGSYIEDGGMPPGMLDVTSAYSGSTGHLLVEVSLFHANAIDWILANPDGDGSLDRSASLEVVVGDSVFESTKTSPQFSTDSFGYLSYSGEEQHDVFYIAATGDVAIYVTSTTPVNLYQFAVEADDRSKIYIEGPSLAVATETSVALQNASFVAVFDSVATESLLLSPGESGEICLAVADSLALGRDSSVNDTQNVALPGATGGFEASGKFECGRMQIPDREPRDLSLPTTIFTLLGADASPSSAPSTSSSSSSSSSSNGSPALTALLTVLVSVAAAAAVAGGW